MEGSATCITCRLHDPRQHDMRARDSCILALQELRVRITRQYEDSRRRSGVVGTLEIIKREHAYWPEITLRSITENVLDAIVYAANRMDKPRRQPVEQSNVV